MSDGTIVFKRVYVGFNILPFSLLIKMSKIIPITFILNISNYLRKKNLKLSLHSDIDPKIIS